MNAYDPKTEELEHLAGDEPDPGMYQTGKHFDPMGTGAMGHASQVDLSRGALAHPMIRYKDFVLEVDVYAVPDSDEISVVLLCPRCRNALKVSSLRKRIEFERPSQRYPQGVLSIEPLRCSWELESDGRRMEFGLGMCNWSVAIDKNIAKDA
jgi:hypothetical protein